MGDVYTARDRFTVFFRAVIKLQARICASVARNCNSREDGADGRALETPGAGPVKATRRGARANACSLGGMVSSRLSGGG